MTKRVELESESGWMMEGEDLILCLLPAPESAMQRRLSGERDSPRDPWLHLKNSNVVSTLRAS